MITSGTWAVPDTYSDDGYSSAEQWFSSKNESGAVTRRLKGTKCVVVIFDGDIEVSEAEIEEKGLLFLDDGMWATFNGGRYVSVKA